MSDSLTGSGSNFGIYILLQNPCLGTAPKDQRNILQRYLLVVRGSIQVVLNYSSFSRDFASQHWLKPISFGKYLTLTKLFSLKELILENSINALRCKLQ